MDPNSGTLPIHPPVTERVSLRYGDKYERLSSCWQIPQEGSKKDAASAEFDAAPTHCANLVRQQAVNQTR